MFSVLIDRLTGRRDRLAPVVACHAALVVQATSPRFYGRDRVADTIEGRFEMLTLHVALTVKRLSALRASEPAAGEFSQELVDVMFDSLDRSLRESGVGDTSVPRRMKKLASGFLGRSQAYGAALDAGDAVALEEAIARNALDGRTGFAPILARYAQEAEKVLSTCTFQEVIDMKCAWPELNESGATAHG